jgi:hypothetical protein
LLTTLLFATTCAAQTTTLYDNFDNNLLNPSKWNTIAACYTDNGMELECVREVRDEKLHLAHRNFGNRDTNVGFQFGSAAVSFVNPSRIKTITSDLVVRRVQESNCPANPLFGPAAHIDATFFNTGSGNPTDDVGGHMRFGHSFSDPPGQVTVFGQISQGYNYFFYLPLGVTSMGTPLRATLTWDQPNHQFLVSWTDLLTNIKTEGIMPYTFTDSTPPADPTKVLTANTFPANCTAKSDMAVHRRDVWQRLHRQMKFRKQPPSCAAQIFIRGLKRLIGETTRLVVCENSIVLVSEKSIVLSWAV